MLFEEIYSNKNKLIEGPLLITNKKFYDERGFFMESFNQKEFNNLVKFPLNFVQDNHSRSKENVLRGMHYQLPPYDQGKLVKCISGKIFDAIIDLRKSSNTFLNWAGIYLDDKLNKQLWIPSGFAHGFLSISKNVELLYKTTSYWNKDFERSLRWNDPSINLKWPIGKQEPFLAEKDKNAPLLKNISRNELFN